MVVFDPVNIWDAFLLVDPPTVFPGSSAAEAPPAPRNKCQAPRNQIIRASRRPCLTKSVPAFFVVFLCQAVLMEDIGEGVVFNSQTVVGYENTDG